MALDPPDIHQVLPQSDVDGPAPDVDAPDKQPTTVQQRSHRDIYVLGEITSSWWALTHPKQAWRIFAPIE